MDLYLNLEIRAVEAYKNNNEYLAEVLHNRLDVIWYKLSDAEHRKLNERSKEQLP